MRWATESRSAVSRSTTVRYWEPLERAARWECAMVEYAAWWGDWDDYHGSYTWQRLNGGHRALGDCLAVAERLVEMAGRAEPSPQGEVLDLAGEAL